MTGIEAGHPVEVRDIDGVWHPAVATTPPETGELPVVLVEFADAPGQRLPWPLVDVRPAVAESGEQ